MELRLTESHDGHDRGAQIQRGGDTWLGAEKHSWIHAFNSCYANMRAIHCICIDIGDCIEISSHPMSDAPFFIHLHQHVSQCHFGESHDYRYSLRKRPCCIPIRNQCFLFSARWTNVCCGGVPADCLWFFAISQSWIWKPAIALESVAVARQRWWGGWSLSTAKQRSLAAILVFHPKSCLLFPIVFLYLFKRCRKPVSMLACGSHMVFPLFRLLFPFTTCQTFSHWQGKAALEFSRIRIKDCNWRRRRVSTGKESSWILLRREGSLTSSNPLAFHGWIL